jgi:hypothetical protein
MEFGRFMWQGRVPLYWGSHGSCQPPRHVAKADRLQQVLCVSLWGVVCAPPHLHRTTSNTSRIAEGPSLHAWCCWCACGVWGKPKPPFVVLLVRSRDDHTSRTTWTFDPRCQWPAHPCRRWTARMADRGLYAGVTPRYSKDTKNNRA